MFVIKKSSIIIVAVLIATILTTYVCLSAINLFPVSETYSNRIKILLDAGHGGVDGGVTGVNTGVKESQLNLEVVRKLEKNLISANFTVSLTRKNDAGLYGVATKNLKRKDMEKRRDIILQEKPDIVISIHMNKYSLSTRRGAQVFYKANDESAKILAQSVQDSLNSMEQAVRECSILTGHYYILNCTDYRSIIVECGFLSSPDDEKLLTDENYQDDLSYHILKGVVVYLAKASYSESKQF